MMIIPTRLSFDDIRLYAKWCNISPVTMATLSNNGHRGESPTVNGK